MRQYINLVEYIDDHVSRSLGIIQSEAYQEGIDLEIVYDGGTIHLELIRVPPRKQGKGMGSYYMNSLIDISDENNIPLTLEAQSFDEYDYEETVDQETLSRFYKKFGFRDTGDTSEYGNPIMLRYPK